MQTIVMRARVNLPSLKARAGECFSCDPATAAALKYQQVAELVVASPSTEERVTSETQPDTDEPRRGRYRRRDMRAE